MASVPQRVAAAFLTALVAGGCADDGKLVPEPASGLRTLQSSGIEREYYVRLPSDYDRTGPAQPVVFAYHGTSGTWELFDNGYYDLAAAVGNEAILVYMQALPDPNVEYQWDFDVDLQYFEDVLRALDGELNIDAERLFATGHSSGAGMVHELGCQFGDVLRAIAPHAGILKGLSCTGSVAVLQTHGINDALVPWGSGESGHEFWVAYNGFEYDLSTPAGVLHPSCVDHSMGGSPYPMVWCLHEEGQGVEAHAWPSFGSEATWAFFSSLDRVAPTADPPSGGGNSNLGALFDTTLTVTLEYPAGIGEVTAGAVSIYPAGTQQPVGGGPQSILTPAFDPGPVAPGSVVTYELPIKYVTESFPGTYAFSVVIYVADGGNPIPLPGRDHIVFSDVDVVDRGTPVVIDQVLVMEEVFY